MNKLVCESNSHVSVGQALIKIVNGLQTFTDASYVNLTEGVSWHGTMLLACMAWHWENRYGYFLPNVTFASNHCSALAFGLVS